MSEILNNLRKRMVFLLTVVCLAVSLAGCSFEGFSLKKDPPSIQRTSFALNTVIDITLYGTEDEDILTQCFKICSDYEKLFSRTIEDSEIAVLNDQGENTVSDETLELLQKGLYYSELSEGAFDITIGRVSSLWDFTAEEPELPDADLITEGLDYIDYEKVQINGNHVSMKDGMMIDLGAIAKGYIADQIKEYLLEQGIESAIINLGGNVLCVGSKAEDTPFTISVRDPFSSYVKPLISVSVEDQSVVTSGTYERYIEVDGKQYHHILNPETGYSYENDLVSVTIISERSVDGDGLSTTCFALGAEKGMELIDSLEDTWAFFVKQDGTIVFSEEFAENISYKKY